MSALEVGRRRLWVPTGSSVKIDWTNPLAQGLKLCWIAGRNLLGPSGANGSPVHGATAYGQAMDFPGVNTTFYNVGPVLNTESKSIVSVAQVDTVTASRTIIEENHPIGPPNRRPMFVQINSSSQVAAGVYDGTNFYLTTTPTVTVGRTHVIGATFSPSAITAYVDGAPGTSVVPASLPATGGYDWRIGTERLSASGAFDGRITFVAAWERALTAYEHAILAADPFCFLTCPTNLARIAYAAAAPPPAPSSSDWDLSVGGGISPGGLVFPSRHLHLVS